MDGSQDQIIGQIQYLKGQLDQVKAQIVQLNFVAQDAQSSIYAIEALKNDTSSMVELAAGVLMPVSQKTDFMLMDVGAGVIVQVPLDRAVILQNAKLERYAKNRMGLEQAVRQIENQLNTLSQQALQQRN